MSQALRQLIFDSSIPFAERAVRVFNFQKSFNSVYSTFAEVLGIAGNITSDFPIHYIPLIPIRVFKEAEIKSFDVTADLIFKSSGTGNMSQSRHFVKESSVYIKSIEKEFYRYFPKENTSILCYTPGYAENPHSSLIWMLNHLVNQDPSGLSRFIPLQQPLKKESIKDLLDSKRNIVLFGAAFGLLDLIEKESDPLPASAQIVETGGMKTHRREISKTELRNILSDGFQILQHQIHSEYGMCELLSQCYAIGGEWFEPPNWVNISVRKAEDPTKICKPHEPGKLGIIDLANLYSCPFILTDDIGIMDDSGRFKVLGRWKKAEMRGCNFLIDRD
ncbi:hypothetical protein [Rhodohalobacter sp.]|uniref:LuxE/PaaK family acyltransferase n=1 Tax=Rhodohalobacter sp. TaxID=1974210 RepID=UPI003561F5F9